MHKRSTLRALAVALPAALRFALPGTLLLALLAAGTAMTRAQAPEPVRQSPGTEQDEARARGAAQDPAPVPPDGAAPEAPTGPLDDYEASEQISEDLSVSFPVDI